LETSGILEAEATSDLCSCYDSRLSCTFKFFYITFLIEMVLINLGTLLSSAFGLHQKLLVYHSFGLYLSIMALIFVVLRANTSHLPVERWYSDRCPCNTAIALLYTYLVVPGFIAGWVSVIIALTDVISK